MNEWMHMCRDSIHINYTNTHNASSAITYCVRRHCVRLLASSYSAINKNIGKKIGSRYMHRCAQSTCVRDGACVGMFEFFILQK